MRLEHLMSGTMLGTGGNKRPIRQSLFPEEAHKLLEKNIPLQTSNTQEHKEGHRECYRS